MAGNKKNYHIAVTGKVGSGKSLASKFIQEMGFLLIDADLIGHKILENEEIAKKVKKIAGLEIILNGKIDRQKLGEIVFSDAEKIEALNSLSWPLIIKEIKRLTAENSRTVTDAALLSQWGIDDNFDLIIYINSSLDNIQSRLSKRGWSAAKIQSVLRNQNWTNIPNSYIIVENNGIPDALKKKILELILVRGAV
ncbi:dephospho-CoA kinase [candidate division WOR-3 bacterium]|nr:dephospho-CoA kinase [candidate division WOR-3 bacterium]